MPSSHVASSKLDDPDVDNKRRCLIALLQGLRAQMSAHLRMKAFAGYDLDYFRNARGESLFEVVKKMKA